MPRGRKQLTDKQERILVQCQLMGLTTADLVTISNRLKALDAEREFRDRVTEIAEGFTWSMKNKKEFTIIDRRNVYQVQCYTEHPDRNWSGLNTDYADITVISSKKKSLNRNVTKYRLNNWENEISVLCPEGSKYLYRVMREIKNGRI